MLRQLRPQGGRVEVPAKLLLSSPLSEAQAQTLGLGTGQVWPPLLLTISTSESRM